MRVHIIVDFMYLYYKYKNTVESGRIKRLTVEIDTAGNVVGMETIEKDISKVFYPIKEIEGFRRTFENEGHEVVVSVCFDAPSPERKEQDSEYKSNRAASRLDTEAFDDIDMIRELLKAAGHNIYWREATEADDLITNLVMQYKDLFDFTVIYTPDTDMLVNVGDKVGVQRYKAKLGYTPVSKVNYKAFCEKEYDCTIPYNSILLFKCLCGDKSDKVAGIKGFGPAAYEKFIRSIGEANIDWEKLRDKQEITELLKGSKYFKEEQLTQALHSLDMVFPFEIEVEQPNSKSTRELRAIAYTPLRMNSLVD